MNIRRHWRMLALLASVVLMLAAALPTSLAYVTAESNRLRNSFTPVYDSPDEASVSIYVRKTVRNLGRDKLSPEGFRFELKNAETGEAFLLTTDAQGHASLALAFTQADLGREHRFTLSEINDGRENVSYSTDIYDICIGLSVNSENKITAAASVNGKPVKKIGLEFENIYNAGIPIPNTGDDFRAPLYAAMVIGGLGGIAALAPRRRQVRK